MSMTLYIQQNVSQQFADGKNSTIFEIRQRHTPMFWQKISESIPMTLLHMVD
jgi:hypothetical protein